MAHCETIRMEDGTVAHVRISGRRKGKPCEFCGRPSGYLCDFILGPRKTCSKAMCEACRTNHGAGVDYCPPCEAKRNEARGIFPERLPEPKLHEVRTARDYEALMQNQPPPADEDPDAWRRTVEPPRPPHRTSWMGKKAEHLRTAPQTRPHTCHWPGCETQVPPALWGCKSHWYRLPQNLRNEILRTYRVGQEDSMDPSPAYMAAADAVQKWIAANAGKAWQ